MDRDPDSNGQPSPDEAWLRRRKLELEVAEMEREHRPSAWRVKGLASTVGVGGALLTLIIGVVEFGQRESERLAQQDRQIEDARREAEARRSAAFREAFGEISTLSPAALAIPRARYLLVSLTQLEEACPATSSCAWERRMVTEQLVYIATRELDYIVSRDAPDLDLTVLDLWPPYEGWFREHPEDNHVILYKEFQGLRHLAASNPAYFAGIRHDASEFRVDTYNEDEEQFLQFSSLTRSYLRHWDLVSDEAARKDAAANYAEALDNATLAASLFGYKEEALDLTPDSSAPANARKPEVSASDPR